MDKDVFIKQSTLMSIADSIREKTGKTEKIDPLYMPDEISTISGGGSINTGFIDGTLTVITAEDLAGVTRIRDYAFYYCDSLTDITIPDSVTTIGSNAFYSCDSLTDITIPDSVTSIGDGAFCDCYSLAEVTIGNSVTTIGASAFGYCDNLTNIVIPDSVTTISSYTFYNCPNLTSVTIPDSVTHIGGYAFFNCTSLTTVAIPDSVTTIGNWAFENCTSLTSVVVEGDTVKALAASNVFSTTPIANATGYIYIKTSNPDDEAALVEEYKNATNWSVYADQIKPYSEYNVS